MITYEYIVTARDRISAGISSGTGNVQEAHQVLPGNTMRGALAAAWWRDNRPAFGADEDEAQARLDRLFERDLIFRQAVPEGAELIGCSAVACKYPEDGRTQWSERAFLLGGELKGCPAEGCQCGGTIGKGWDTRSVRAPMRTSVELDDDGRAKQGQLFSRRSVEARTVFRGQILLREGAQLDQGDLDWLTGSHLSLRIGGRRTVLGGATFECGGQSAVGERRPADLADDVDTGGEAEPTRVVLRLASPAIIVDDFGAPVLDAGPEFARVFGLDRDAIEREWVRTVAVSGWHGRARLPRPVEWALDAGSTWVVNLPSGSDVAAKLAGGIGLRTTEGFGEVWIVTGPPKTPAPEPPGEYLVNARVGELVASLRGSERATALKGLSDGLRDACDRGATEALKSMLGKRWAQNLSAPNRTAIEDLFENTSLAEATIVVAAASRAVGRDCNVENGQVQEVHP